MTAREELLAELRRAIADERVLDAIARVPRERFVPPALRDRAWDNSALGIGSGQTISQPLVVARMAELLDVRPGDRLLDVGTGSGYHAAVLAALGARVWSIERHRELSESAAQALRDAGVEGVTLVVGDGTRGLPDEAPFDAVNVAAATPRDALGPLEAQLAEGGRLVAPVRHRGQRLVLVRRVDGELRRERLEEVRFVPLVRGEAES